MELAKPETQAIEQANYTWKNRKEFLIYILSPDFLHTRFPVDLLVTMPNDFLSLLAQMIHSGFISTKNISNPKLFKVLYKLNNKGNVWCIKYDQSFHVKEGKGYYLNPTYFDEICDYILSYIKLYFFSADVEYITHNNNHELTVLEEIDSFGVPKELKKITRLKLKKLRFRGYLDEYHKVTEEGTGLLEILERLQVSKVQLKKAIQDSYSTLVEPYVSSKEENNWHDNFVSFLDRKPELGAVFPFELFFNSPLKTISVIATIFNSGFVTKQHSNFKQLERAAFHLNQKKDCWFLNYRENGVRHVTLNQLCIDQIISYFFNTLRQYLLTQTMYTRAGDQSMLELFWYYVQQQASTVILPKENSTVLVRKGWFDPGYKITETGKKIANYFETLQRYEQELLKKYTSKQHFPEFFDYNEGEEMVTIPTVKMNE
jgi:hypothetical protein